MCSSLMGNCNDPLSWPALTGEVSRRLRAPESRIVDAIRRGCITAPRVRAGRRLWTPQEVRDLARFLGVLTPDLARELAVPGDAEVAP